MCENFEILLRTKIHIFLVLGAAAFNVGLKTFREKHLKSKNISEERVLFSLILGKPKKRKRVSDEDVTTAVSDQTEDPPLKSRVFKSDS